jgi:fatty-acyl-CoA synthase
MELRSRQKAKGSTALGAGGASAASEATSAGGTNAATTTALPPGFHARSGNSVLVWAYDQVVSLLHCVWLAIFFFQVYAWFLFYYLFRRPFTVADLWEDSVGWYRMNEALAFEGRSYSYEAMDAEVNRVANWAALAEAQGGAGLRRADAVAVFMHNRPEFVFAWLGLAKIGARAALINSNLHGDSLFHAVDVSAASAVIVGPELLDALATVLPKLAASGRPMRVFVYAGADPAAPAAAMRDAAAHGLSVVPLDPALARASTLAPARSVRLGISLMDPVFYIYTSGTTGMPKPCIVSHKRVHYFWMVFSTFNFFSSSTRVYVALPMYHTNGGVVSTSAWMYGGCVIMRRKFSASQFWEDCRKYRATTFIYIGELCRYLMAQPPSPADRDHSVTRIIGNGLRGDIWKQFQERFGVRYVFEFYGSTEGNVGFVNATYTYGSCGLMPELAQFIMGVDLVRYDVENDTHVRDKRTGMCVPCRAGEVGEALARISHMPLKMGATWDGYTDRRASDSKVLRDVRRRGDQYFRTGDLMMYDSQGHWFFVDRIGDTFRWKGENVATSEVEAVINELPWLKEATVYGVHIPSKDGRAGMASIVLADASAKAPTAQKLAELHDLLVKNLPVYSWPLFLRIMPAIDATTTFKHNKRKLMLEACDPAVVSDPMFFFQASARGFVSMTSAIYAGILSGEIPL